MYEVSGGVQFVKKTIGSAIRGRARENIIWDREGCLTFLDRVNGEEVDYRVLPQYPVANPLQKASHRKIAPCRPTGEATGRSRVSARHIWATHLKIYFRDASKVHFPLRLVAISVPANMALTRFRYKVKPRKGMSSLFLLRYESLSPDDQCTTTDNPPSDPLVVNCAAELTTLLACFASTGDMRSSEACATAAKTLHTCIAGKPKSVPRPAKSSVSLTRRLYCRKWENCIACFVR
jgi:hypothetical protein